MVDRRKFLKSSVAAGVTASLPMGWVIRQAGATPACGVLGCETEGLSDPACQFANAGFVNPVPDAMAPSFIYTPGTMPGGYDIRVGTSVQQTGLINGSETLLDTPIWGYGETGGGVTWPGKTFQIQSGKGTTKVRWRNELNGVAQHLLPVDTSLHCCYALHGYTQYTIANAGVPIITHLHGGHTDFEFDGNPEFFYGPKISGHQVTGPQWDNVRDGFTNRFSYDNKVPAGTLWYHDHALGITRLNVYAGMAGFYIVRDDQDTGMPGNPLDLPAWPYEKLYAIQDRMFLETGELFYPAFPGDPFYDDFITGEGAELPPDVFPGGGPTAWLSSLVTTWLSTESSGRKRTSSRATTVCGC
jgi:FtsP/CotA-like multicopper oxidase with cupredoxin domain